MNNIILIGDMGKEYTKKVAIPILRKVCNPKLLRLVLKFDINNALKVTNTEQNWLSINDIFMPLNHLKSYPATHFKRDNKSLVLLVRSVLASRLDFAIEYLHKSKPICFE